jgi:hypothetical protein
VYFLRALRVKVRVAFSHTRAFEGVCQAERFRLTYLQFNSARAIMNAEILLATIKVEILLPFLIQLFIGSNTRFRRYACEGDQSFQRFSDAVFDHYLGQLVRYS